MENLLLLFLRCLQCVMWNVRIIHISIELIIEIFIGLLHNMYIVTRYLIYNKKILTFMI